MTQAILLVTWAGTLKYCRQLLESFAYDKPIVVAINEAEVIPPEDENIVSWMIEQGYEVIPIEGNRWECGALTAMITYTAYEEFILIQDTLEVKDTSIFDTMFNLEGKSVAFGRDWLCFLGKYRKQVLDQLSIPVCLTKMDAVYQEHMFPYAYSYVAEKVEGSIPIILFPEWANDNPKNYYEEKFGRMNIVLDNPFLIKRKGNTAKPVGRFGVTVLHK